MGIYTKLMDSQESKKHDKTEEAKAEALDQRLTEPADQPATQDTTEQVDEHPAQAPHGSSSDLANRSEGKVDQPSVLSASQTLTENARESGGPGSDDFRFSNEVESRVLPKGKSFYITERLSKNLDEAVRYFKEVHHIQNADRSALLGALIDDESIWDRQHLDSLTDRLLDQLTNRLVNR
jgi:hypothetical protein